MCSIRSAYVSMWPYSIVALERMPRPWAIRWISSQRSAPALPVKRSAFWRRAEKISAPPPGMVWSPAAFRRASASPGSIFHRRQR